jgi:hypothetical protein
VVHILILEIIVMATVTKAVLAAQNAELRAMLSQYKADLAALRASTSASASAPSTQPTRVELMAYAKRLAMHTGQVTQIRDGQVQVKSNGQWVPA